MAACGVVGWTDRSIQQHLMSRLSFSESEADFPYVEMGGMSLNNPSPVPSPSPLPAPFSVDSYTQPFLDFLNDKPTIFHAVDHFAERLEGEGFSYLSERDAWSLKAGGKYYMIKGGKGGSAMIAFVVGEDYKPGNGAAIIGAHIDVLTAKLKPVSKLPTKAGYLQLGVAPYAGGLNHTWLDRNLSIGGKVLLQDPKTGKVTTRIMKLDWAMCTIPTLAPHFGAPSNLPYNLETQMVPIMGLDGPSSWSTTSSDPQGFTSSPPITGLPGSFISMQPPRLVKAITTALGLSSPSTIINWELELFVCEPSVVGGIDKEFLFASRIDDRICSFAAIEALIASRASPARALSGAPDGLINMVLLVDAEEIGSQTFSGAKSNLLPLALERIVDSFAEKGKGARDLMGRTLANSFFVSADVNHAVHPNFLDVHLAQHSSSLNVGVGIATDAQGHFTTTSVSMALMARIASKCSSTLQLVTPRNDTRDGGTIGPVISSITGLRSIDLGCVQTSMHSARAMTGAKDPGLGVKIFKGFFDYYEEVDKEFRED